MRRRSRAVLAAAALAFGCLPAPAGEAATERATLSGTFVVVGDLTIGKNVPVGTTVSINVGASSGNLAGSHSVTATAAFKREAAKKTVVLSLPYTWSFAGAPGPVYVYLSASAGNSFTDISIAMSLPKNGAKAEVDLPAAL